MIINSLYLKQIERITYIFEKVIIHIILPVCIVKIMKELVTIQLLSSCVRLYNELIYPSFLGTRHDVQTVTLSLERV